jgi:hypothetical protein
MYELASTSNGTNERGIFGGGRDGGGVIINNIDYITINVTGNATDFGDLTVGAYTLSACSDS